MKRKLMVALVGVVLLMAQAGAAEDKALKTQNDKVNYGIGVSVAKNFQNQELEVDLDLVVQGMKDVLSGKKLLLSDDELRATMTAFQEEMRRKHMEQKTKAAGDNKKLGDDFLAANKKKEGVVTLDSGLQYKILKAGKGQKPTEENTVDVKYRGTFIDGKEFDSSKDGAATFKVGGIIPGWREALKLMPVGSKWQLVIPPSLAYGEKGAGRTIGPNATLVFEVELVAIK